jgi:hypothetical protein
LCENPGSFSLLEPSGPIEAPTGIAEFETDLENVVLFAILKVGT